MVDIKGLLPVLASLVTGGLSTYIWQRRTVPGARAFSLFAASVAVWCFFAIFEFYSRSLTPRIIFGKLEYLGIVTLPVSWLLFTLHYTRRSNWLTRHLIGALLIIPLSTLLLTLTDGWHGLLWRSVHYLNTPVPLLDIDHGPWFHFVLVPYTYVLFAIGIIVLLASFFADSSLYRKQTGIVLASMAVPLLVNAHYLMTGATLGGLDPTPYAFALCVALNAYGLFGSNQLPITPVSYRALFLNTAETVIVLNNKFTIIDINPAALDELGHTKADVLGKTFCSFYPQCKPIMQAAQQGQVADVVELLSPNGSSYAEVKIRPVFTANGEVSTQLVIMRDVTAEREQQARLEQFAYVDSLTGVANRRQLAREADRAIGLARRYNLPLSLLYMDIDKFKSINDTYGHEIGDLVLVHVAHCLRGTMRENDVVARLGGDEFAILLYDVDYERADETRERFQKRLCKPFEVETYQLAMDVSIGLALYPDHGATLEDLLREADASMYRSKHKKSSLSESNLSPLLPKRRSALTTPLSTLDKAEPPSN